MLATRPRALTRLSTFRQLAVTLLATACTPFLLPAAPAERDAEAVERYMQDVRFLAAPEMRGRGAGMPELDQAAEYIVGQFREAGLQPAGEGDTFRQPFEVTTGASMGDGNSMQVTRPRGTSELEVGKDFIPINFSGSGEVEGEVVFAGYGAMMARRGAAAIGAAATRATRI